MDDLSRQRFLARITEIARAHSEVAQTIRELHVSTTRLHAMLENQVEALERVYGTDIAEIIAIKIRIEATWAVFADPLLFAAIDSVHDEFSRTSIELAQMLDLLERDDDEDENDNGA